MSVLATKQVDRKYLINLYGKPNSPYERRPTFPGQHGPNGRRRSNIYSKTLRGVQIVRFYYALTEGQLKKVYLKAHRKPGNTVLNICCDLESKVRTVLYRSGFAPTMYAAKQLVSHGHVLLNGSRINTSTISLRPGDVLEIKPKARTIPYVTQAMSQDRKACDYIEVSKEKFTVKYLRYPNEIAEVPHESEIDFKFVIENYSG